MVSKRSQYKPIIIVLALIAVLFYLGSILDTTTVQINLIEKEIKKIKPNKELDFPNNKPLKNKIGSISYNFEYPFSILNDTDFLKFPFISGNGDKNNPYIIENLNITEPGCTIDLIIIKNTSVHFSIRNCWLSGGTTGIHLRNASNGLVENNTIFGCYFDAISMFDTNKTIIRNNQIFDANWSGVGMYSHAREIQIFNNTIMDCSWGIYGTSFYHSNITNNLFFSLDQAISLWRATNIQITNNNIYQNVISAVFLRNTLNIIISKNNISHNLQSGIKIGLSSNKTTIFGNNISNTSSGSAIEIKDHSLNNSISKNKIVDNEKNGIVICNNSNQNYLFENEIIKNKNTSISLDQNCSFNIISSNRIINNSQEGILVAESSFNNTFFNNTILNNDDCGIVVSTYSENNSFFNNSFVMNNDYGVFLNFTTRSNIFSWNDFIINSRNEQNSQAYDDGEDNVFCYNYWNEWTEPDSNNDGFVDIPYNISGSAINQDPFPLADPNNPLLISQSNILGSPPIYESIAYLLSIFLSISIIGIAVGLVFTTRRKIVSSQSISKNSQKKYAFNSTISPSSIPTLETETSSLDKKEEWKNREFPDKSSWLIVIIAATVGFILQIVRPPQIRNLSYDQVVDHPVRREILKILRERQIIHFSALKRLLNCGTSVLLWHLQVLEDFNLIYCKTLNKIKAYYLVNSGISPSKVDLFCAIQNQKGLLISSSLLTIPIKGWSIKDLSNQTNLNKKAVRYYCKKLESLGVVDYLNDPKQFKLVSNQTENLLWLLQLYNYKQ